MANLEVPVPPWVCRVARVQRVGDPISDPGYAKWTAEYRLRVRDILFNSSVAGHSYGRVSLSSGLPHSAQIEPENAERVLTRGDRIALGLQEGRNVRWLFCGYVTSNATVIDTNAETVTYRIAGPEWWWGEPGSVSGGRFMVRGQLRRTAAEDDAYRGDLGRVAAYNNIHLFTGVPTVFNPEGRRNMTQAEAIISPPGRPTVQGRIWELEDRRVSGTDVALHWNMWNACQTLVEQYGDVEFSGIEVADWNDVPLSLTDVMKETRVDGLNLYEALRAVVGNKYSFWIDPTPLSPVNGNAWGPFRLIFYPRSTGPAAVFVLNPKGTPMRNAQASVSRVETIQDIGKTINRVVVRGAFIRNVKLYYWGGRTPTLPANLKKTALQNGWTTTFADITAYSNTNDVTIGTIDAKAVGALRDWRRNYVTSGDLYLSGNNLRAFRYFVWNEANELDVTQSTKYGATAYNWYAPDLAGIADSPDEAGLWVRRRRRMLDTLYLADTTRDRWTRIPPAVFMAIAPDAASSDYGALKWRRMPESTYQLDPQRVAILFTADDLAEWRPFDKQESGEAEADKNWPHDSRTFATLLKSGTMRICLEFSIECDNALTAAAERSDLSGNPHVREQWINAPDNFFVTLSYDDGLSSPSGLAPSHVDLRTQAQALADVTRDAAQEQNVHGSIYTAGDWPRQQIGATIKQIDGRVLRFTTSAGRGAQIVAARLDPNGLKWEYLTETLALQLTRRIQKTITSGGINRARRQSRRGSVQDIGAEP